MIDGDHAAVGLELRVIQQLIAAHDRTGRPRPRACSAVDRLADTDLRVQLSTAASRTPTCVEAALGIGKARIAEPFGASRCPAQGPPVIVAVDADRHPGVRLAAGIDAVRRFQPVAIAGALRIGIVEGEIDDRFRNERHHRLVHGEIDELALPGPVAVVQRRHDREHAVGAAQRIGQHAAQDARLAIEIAGHVGDAAEQVYRAVQAAGVFHRTRAAERAAGHHDETGIELADHVVAETELFQHTGREIVDHHVDLAGQTPHDVAPGRGRHVQRAALLRRCKSG